MTEKSNAVLWRYLIGLFFGILFVSTAAIFIRFAQAEASSLIIAAYRLTISSFILGIIVIVSGTDVFKVFTRKQLWLALLAGIFLAVHFASWITSLAYTSVASSVVLVTTTPLWVAMLSPLVLKEPIRKNVIAGLIVAMLGGAIVGLSNMCVFQQGSLTCTPISYLFSGRALLGNGLALFGAFMAAGYMLVGRRLRSTVDTLPYAFVVYGISAILIDIVVVINGENLFNYASATWMWFIGLAVFPQLLGHSIFNWALRYLPASVVSIALLGEPIGSTLLAYIFLKEQPTIIEMVGGILILIGITVASLQKQRVNVA